MINNLCKSRNKIHKEREREIGTKSLCIIQDILNVGFLSFFSKWNIAYVLHRMRSVVYGFGIAGSLQISKFAKPFLMRHHMV